jgi:hypothetical protein
MTNGIFKQKNVGTWWGAFRNLGSYVSFYLTLANFFVLLINTYILGNITMFNSPIPMWAIIAIVIVVFVLLLLVAMLFEHKYTIPSFMTYWNQQFYLHGNLLKDRMDKREPEVDKRDKHLQDTVDSVRKELQELREYLKLKEANNNE